MASSPDTAGASTGHGSALEAGRGAAVAGPTPGRSVRSDAWQESAATTDGPDRGSASPATGAGADGPPARPETPRVRLARVAASATAATHGVASLDRGPRDAYCTHAGRERLPGVLVIADGEPGTYDVSVYVRAELIDLHALADDVRTAIRAAATEHDLSGHLGEIRVAITDIDDGTTTA